MHFRKAFAGLMGFLAVAASPALSAAATLEPQSTIASAAPAAGSAAVPLDKADLAAWLNGFVPYALKSGDIAGAVVVVVKDGEVLFGKGYGYADVAAKTPMDFEDTLIRPGSTSKLFTWTAVMQLVEQHRLDLDRDVNAYLDFTIPHKAGRPVTLRDLMNHRAGFEEGLKDILATNPDGLPSTETYLKQHPRPQLFAPGVVPAYSNYGASLAGYIVQRVSGEPFERYVERHIFLPLGMAHSTFDQPLPQRFRAGLAKGYVTASSQPGANELVVTRPAGSVTTTAADMARFMIAHLDRSGAHLLQPATLKTMHAPSESGLPGFSTMAHGFFHDIHNGRTVIGHGGDTVLFHTEMDLLPAEGVGIFYSFNSRGKDDAVYGARQSLFDGFMDRYFPSASPLATPPALASAAKDAGEIAGCYESSRRVEHGFLSLFYLLQQTSISANADGTITGPAAPGLEGNATFREVAPQIWRETGSSRELALAHIDGVKTVIDSTDPISVLQAVPFARNASLNLTVLLASLAVLVWTLVLWPLSPLLRRGDRAAIGISPDIVRLRLLLRFCALASVVYLVAWAMLLQPVLSSQLQVYSSRLDSVVRLLQVAGLVPLVAAGSGVWLAWRLVNGDAPVLSKIWSTGVALALLGIFWIAFMGNLLSFDLNY